MLLLGTFAERNHELLRLAAEGAVDSKHVTEVAVRALVEAPVSRIRG